MNPGKLIHTGRLKAPSVTANDEGEPINTPVEYATIKFSMNTTGGREMYAARQVNAEVNFQMEIWRRSDVLTGHTLEMDVPNTSIVRTFDILLVNNSDERPRDTLLFCREVNPSVS
jgi:SPP1 family predicted phage head-tail adaptor